MRFYEKSAKINFYLIFFFFIRLQHLGGITTIFVICLGAQPFSQINAVIYLHARKR